jgi:hypothetical protein
LEARRHRNFRVQLAFLHPIRAAAYHPCRFLRADFLEIRAISVGSRERMSRDRRDAGFQEDGMADRWMLRGREYGNCNCAWGCPCQFNSPSTNGFCEAVTTGHIDEGYFNEARLDGLSYVILLQWPGEIADGNGRQQVIIDERADADQREALGKILHGESTAPGATHFFVFSSTMSELLETLYAPVDLTIDIEARQARVSVPGLVESVGSPITDPHSGEAFRAATHGSRLGSS